MHRLRVLGISIIRSRPKTSAVAKAFGIPEVAQLCAQFLDGASLSKSLYISRDWHNNVVEMNWRRTIIISPDGSLYDKGGRPLPLTNIETYGSHVQRVIMMKGHTFRFPDIWEHIQGLPQLRELSLGQIQNTFKVVSAHFLTLTDINVEFAPYGFWGKVLSSCGQLARVKVARLSLQEVDSVAPPWACTSLEVLHLTFQTQLDIDCPNRGPREQHNWERALMARVLKLQKLTYLAVDQQKHRLTVRQQFPTTLHPNSWEALSKLTKVKYLRLAKRLCPVISKQMVTALLSMKSLETLHGDWPLDGDQETSESIMQLQDRHIKVNRSWDQCHTHYA